MPRRSFDAKELKGLFIDQDPKKGCVYYDVFTKKGYILSNSDVKTYNLYSVAFPLAIVAGYLVFLLKFPLWSAIVAAVAIYIISKIMFRYKFLYTLPEIPNYVRKNKDNIIVLFSKKYSTPRLVVLTFLLLAISIVTVINANISNYEGVILYLNYVLSLIVGVCAILSFTATILSIRNNK